MAISCMPEHRLSEAKRAAPDELSDPVLYGYSQPIYPNRFFGGTSRIGLMIMTRTIVEYMESETASSADTNEK